MIEHLQFSYYDDCTTFRYFVFFPVQFVRSKRNMQWKMYISIGKIAWKILYSLNDPNKWLLFIRRLVQMWAEAHATSDFINSFFVNDFLLTEIAINTTIVGVDRFSDHLACNWTDTRIRSTRQFNKFELKECQVHFFGKRNSLLIAASWKKETYSKGNAVQQDGL